MLTNSDLAKLKRLLKSPNFADLSVSYQTFRAIKKLSQQIETALKPIAEVEQKYLQDGAADENYQKYLTGLNQLRKDQPNIPATIAKHREENAHLIEDQQKRTAEFQALLDSEADVELPTFNEDDHADLFASELSTAEWDVLSLVMDMD